VGCRAVGVDGARRAARARREITVGGRGACVRRGTCGESLMELMLSRGVCVVPVNQLWPYGGVAMLYV